MRGLISRHTALTAGICLLFFSGQLSHVYYGTWINNESHIENQPAVANNVSAKLGRDAIVSKDNNLDETENTWLLRYKLYAVTADEMVNLMALSRIDPLEFQFDPHFYMYGGGYLYPIIIWYAIGHVIGLLPLPTLSAILETPDIADTLYAWGRIFVLTATTISGWVFYKTARLIFSPIASTALLTTYLAASGTIIFSIAMKPHWYALLWAMIALYYIVWTFVIKRLSFWGTAMIGISLGLAVGSSMTYGLFAVIVYGALITAWKRSYLSIHQLLAIPVIAGALFLAVNPYILVNHDAYAAEQEALFGWYTLHGNLADVGLFMRNSLLAGFGITTVFALLASIRQLLRPASTLKTGLAVALLGLAVFAGVITSMVSYWNNAYRIIPFFLPLALLLIAKTYSTRYVVLIAGITVVLAVPTVTAYIDEKNPRHSTRMQAAQWIESNIPGGSVICTQMVPYNSVPFDFTRYKIGGACDATINVHPHITTRDVGEPIAEFLPRWHTTVFPLVYGEINPRVTITR